MIASKPRLLGISGSLRRASFNTAVLASLVEVVSDRATLEIFPLNDVPLYDQDNDRDVPPPAVAVLGQAIARADGIVISSPEYNFGISGVLKNALDWASRPRGRSKFTGKPVLTMTVSTAFTGGARAQAQLNETLTAIAARVVLRPQIVIASVHDKIKEGRLADEATLGFLIAGVEDLLRDIDWIAKFESSRHILASAEGSVASVASAQPPNM
jgi:chromate reductase